MPNPTVLAVDDDPTNNAIIRDIFDEAPLTLMFAETGERALELIEARPQGFDLVLLDRMLPGIDGMEVLRRMRTIPSSKHTPVIMQTAAAAPEQVAQGLKAGAHYYLTKPYAPESLRSIVRIVLDDASARRELQLRTAGYLESFGMMQRGTFRFRTLDEAARLATLLSQMCGEPTAGILGLAELLINAVEHGNLAISYKEKSQLKREDSWQKEIERRLQLPEYKERKVLVEVERVPPNIQFTITDEGAGFDWRPYQQLDP